MTQHYCRLLRGCEGISDIFRGKQVIKNTYGSSCSAHFITVEGILILVGHISHMVTIFICMLKPRYSPILMPKSNYNKRKACVHRSIFHNYTFFFGKLDPKYLSRPVTTVCTFSKQVHLVFLISRRSGSTTLSIVLEKLLLTKTKSIMSQFH